LNREEAVIVTGIKKFPGNKKGSYIIGLPKKEAVIINV
jgi:hypothetical protein